VADLLERIAGCLNGLAVGDAIGKQTETLSRDDVHRWYPQGVRGFEGAPGSVIPRYVGNRKHAWTIGETTDDTEGTIAVARAILEDGAPRHVTIGRHLLGCRKSIHPGVASLWEFHQAADPSRTTDRHDGCGAAIRVAPVGLVYGSQNVRQIVNGAREASISTHGGPLAIAAAAATAAAVSAAVDGAEPDAILELAQQAAGLVSPVLATALATIAADLSMYDTLDVHRIAASWFPDRPLTIVPLALALGTAMSSAREAILLAANVGGDSDSVASIAGAILGARRPTTVDDEWSAVVERINGHDLGTLAYELCRLRADDGRRNILQLPSVVT
jgi:ADP-ribosylglycohydrolase